MALITCPECRKEISDRAEVCIYCGYPIQKTNMSNSFTVLLNSIGDNRPLTIKCIREIKNIDIIPAMKIVDNIPSVICFNISLREAEKIKNKLNLIGATVIIKEYKEDDSVCVKNENNSPHCPRCGSSSITTGQRGFNIWTGFLGSNKTVNRCANCGWTWQPKG